MFMALATTIKRRKMADSGPAARDSNVVGPCHDSLVMIFSSMLSVYRQLLNILCQ